MATPKTNDIDINAAPKPENVVYLFDGSEIPFDGTYYRPPQGTHYILARNSVTFPLGKIWIPGSGTNGFPVRFSGTAGLTQDLIIKGFTGDGVAPFGELQAHEINFVSLAAVQPSPTFDDVFIDSSLGLQFNLIYLFDKVTIALFNKFGEINTNFLVMDKIQVFEGGTGASGEGVVINRCDQGIINALTFLASNDTGITNLKIQGDIDTLFVNNLSDRPIGSTSSIEIDPAVSITSQLEFNGVIYSDVNGGSLLAPGSLDQTADLVNFQNSTVPDSTVSGIYGMSSNAVETTINVIGQWEKVAGVTVASAENERATMTDNNQLTLNMPRDTKIKLDAQVVALGASGSATDYEFAFFRNSTIVNGTFISPATLTNKAIGITLSAFITGSKDDVIELFVRNVQNTNNMTVVDLNSIVFKV